MFSCFCVEFIFREESIYELPVWAIRCFHMSDHAELFEEALGVKEFFPCSDIVEISILDDFLEVCSWFREEYSCHDNSLYFFYSLFWMSLFWEPLACYACTDMFIFLILFRESCIMEKTCELEIYEIISLDSFCHGEICSTIKNSLCMSGIVVWIIFAHFEYSRGVCASWVDNIHRKRVIVDIRYQIFWFCAKSYLAKCCIFSIICQIL